MKIEILDDARADLVEGYRFYKMQSAGVGAYFLRSLLSDLDSLPEYAASIGWLPVHIDAWPRDFHSPFSPFITGWKAMSSVCVRFLTAVAIQLGFKSDSESDSTAPLGHCNLSRKS